MKTSFSKTLLNWYAVNKRSLPWRDQSNPYWIWVSEIMAQQTRLETVIPYFHRWIEKFPSIEKLANGTDQEVLNLWEGLGYYSRGRNLHKAAKMVEKDFSGKLPEDIKSLRTLPGIGPYTAGAIASLAFGRDEPVVDGNVKRVISRVFNVSEEVNTPRGEKLIWKIAKENLPSGKAGDYNQGLMDLGATICLPRNPTCNSCPISKYCEANRLGLQTELPRKKQRPRSPHYMVTAAVIRRDEKYLIAQRPPGGLLAGLWEFPGGKQEEGESLEESLVREIEEELAVGIEVGHEIGVYKHAYTHFKVTLHAFQCELLKGEPIAVEASEINWVKLAELDDYPMGKIDREISKTLIKTIESKNGT